MGLMMHLRNGEDATTLMIDCMGDRHCRIGGHMIIRPFTCIRHVTSVVRVNSSWIGRVGDQRRIGCVKAVGKQ